MICRLCETEDSDGIAIFGPTGSQLSISSILSKHYDLTVSESDSFSKIVCRKCWQITDQFHELYCFVEKLKCKYTDFRIDKNNTRTSPPEKIKTEDDLIDFASYKDTTRLPSENAIKIEDFLDNEIAVESRSFDDDATSDGSPEKWTSKRRKVRRDVKKRKGTSSKKDRLTSTTNKSVKLNRFEVLEEDREIASFLGLMCEICHTTTKSFSALKQHFRIEHEVLGYIRCCKKKFSRRTRLYRHIKYHNNPDRFKCNVCDKSYVDEECLNRHLKRHDPWTKIFQCTHCRRRFERQPLLDKHIYEVHGDAPKTFTCDICDKNFVSKVTVSSHILAVHANKYSKICDVCAQVFKSQSQLDYHYQVKHLGVDLPKVQCTICGAWLANQYGLRKHIRRHDEKEETCSICGKKSPNKNALGNHMRSVHSGRLFQCQMCDKTFKSQITLREHIGSHTGYSMYKCPYCSIEFKSGANMHKHRKKIHPNEWLQDRGKRLDTRYNYGTSAF